MEGTERYDSWDSYEEHAQRLSISNTGDDRNCYLPSPREIEKRKKIMKWLDERKFHGYMIDAIMIDETPPFSLVKQLVWDVGLQETHRRLKRFLG